MLFLKRHASLIAVLLLISFGGLLLRLAADDSATFDERAHIPAAYSYLRYGDIRLNPEHPPLLKDLAGIPLLFLDVQFPDQSELWQNGINEQWEIGSLFLNCTDPTMLCNKSDPILFWSRVPIILVALAFGAFLFFWMKKISGPVGALIALLFFVTDPNIIAHSHYVTTDIGIAAFLLFAFYFFLQFLRDPSWKNTFWFALFFSLVQIVKFSAVLLFPIFGLFVVLYTFTRTLPSGITSRLGFLLHYIGKLLLVTGFFVVFVWGAYYFHTMHMPAGKLPPVAELMFRDYGVAAAATQLITVLDASPLLRPWAAYLLGVFMVFGRVAGGNTHYFLGTVQADAERLYFPVVFLTKESLAFLFLLVITSGYSLWRWCTIKRPGTILERLQNFLATKIETSLFLFFILFYAGISIFGNLNIGFRHLFPILPFLYILVAKTTVCFLKEPRFPSLTKQLLGLLVSGLLLYQATLPFIIYPNFLSYFNVLGGGTNAGYRVATDSNYDWGQDLKRLETFVTTHNLCVDATTSSTLTCDSATASLPKIDLLRVDYFGGSNPHQTLSVPVENWWSERTPEAGWYALSVNTLQENWASSYFFYSPAVHYRWLQDLQPVARAGTSIFIYYLPASPSFSDFTPLH